MNEATTEWLTAAECAARTGLTVRALRVYENYGLITPGRSAAGWRRYGAQELLKLNEIGLLKVLGLTLSQIRDLTRRPPSPTLRQLLELQRDTWKHRRAEAERRLARVAHHLGADRDDVVIRLAVRHTASGEDRALSDGVDGLLQSACRRPTRVKGHSARGSGVHPGTPPAHRS